MGIKAYDRGMFIILNANFTSINHWSPFPPWIHDAGRAKWPDRFGTGANFLRQTCPILANETYKITIDIEVTGILRDILVSIGDVGKLLSLPPGVHHEEFDLTPTVGNLANIAIAVTIDVPTTVFIDNWWAWGKPDLNSIYGKWFDWGFGSPSPMQFEQTSNINGDKTFRCCNVNGKTRMNIRYTP